MTTAAADWDLGPYFTGIDGADFRQFRDQLAERAARVRERAGAMPAVSSASRAAWLDLLSELEQLGADLGHLGSYLTCLGAADAGDEAAQRETAAYGLTAAELTKAMVAVRARFGSAAGDDLDDLLAADPLRDVSYYLSRVRARAALSMPPEQEALAADLAIDGISAWGRLYDRVSGKLTFEHAVPGQEVRRLPVSMVRSLLEDPDPSVRDAASRGAAAAWESVADTVAACLNAISGTRLALYRRRGIPHYLEPALFDAAISRDTLDAMMEAVRARQDVAHRFLRRKASLLGKEHLGAHDLLAPLPGDDAERIAWQRGTDLVVTAFAAAYPALAEFARHAIAERWIDHSPRPGKRPGGFCTSSKRIQQSRVFMTYHGAVGDVRTLAHELGHAYHNWVMRDMRPWQRAYPMTLAETASTFAENLVTEAALGRPDIDSAARARLLDAKLIEAAVFLCDIPSRFSFERGLYEARQGGELSVRELCQRMTDAQRENYGDALDPDRLDPWFWASKLHFYITGLSFYNFPYTFGYLFSQGLFARARAEGPGFWAGYERLLRDTAGADAHVVARRAIGVDLEAPQFWHESIDLIERDLEAFEQATSR